MAKHGHIVRIWNENNGDLNNTNPALYAKTFNENTLEISPYGWKTFSSAGTWSNYSFSTNQDGMGDQCGIAEYTGKSQPHNNLPQYKVMVIWKRIS